MNGLSLIKAELYNPVTGTYSTTGNMPSTRQEHTAVLRPYSIMATFWLQVVRTSATNSAARNSSDACKKQRAK